MKIKTILLLSISSLLLSAFRVQASTQPVRLTIKSRQGNALSVVVGTPNLFTFSQTELIRAKLNKTGNTVLDLPISQTTFVNLTIGEQLSTLLLSPGDNLEVTLTGEGKNQNLRFAGLGAGAASYLSQASDIWHQYEERGGRHFLQLAPAAFARRLDSLQKAYVQLDRQSAQLASLSPPIRHLLQQRNRIKWLTYTLNYALAMDNPTDSLADGSLHVDQVAQEIPFDSTLLAAHLYEYGLALTFWMQPGLYGPLVKGKTPAQRALLQEQLPLLADQQVRNGRYPAAIRAFLRAKLLEDLLRQQGITTGSETLRAELQKEVYFSAYAPTLDEQFAKWRTLAAGQPAPDFSGITPDGQTLSLSSLKGKVVYIDIWATWCVPCREELPQAKQLQQHFASNPNVAFLYLSIDRDQEAWKRLLAADPLFKGVHLNQPPGASFDSFWQAYQLSGIPRYLLIDQAGKFVDANAARPSSGQVEKAIQTLLH